MDPTTVTIKIGPTSKPFHVHRDLLVRNSRYFSAAFEGGFEEAKEGMLNLTDVEEAPFRAYMHWLYTGEVDHERGSAYLTRKAYVRYLYDLINLYILADRLDARRLRNQVLDAFCTLHQGTYYFPDDVRLRDAFAVVPEASKLSQLLAEVAGHRYNSYLAGPDEIDNLATLPQRVLAELFRSSRPKKAKLPKYMWRFCQHYHEHVDEEERTACLKGRSYADGACGKFPTKHPISLSPRMEPLGG